MEYLKKIFTSHWIKVVTFCVIIGFTLYTLLMGITFCIADGMVGFSLNLTLMSVVLIISGCVLAGNIAEAIEKEEEEDEK